MFNQTVYNITPLQNNNSPNVKKGGTLKIPPFKFIL